MRKEREAPSLPAVMVRLNNTPPRGGGYQMMIRIRRDDKAVIERASRALAVSQSDFMRSLCVNGAREVLQQLGIPEPVYVPPKQESLADALGDSELSDEPLG